MVHLWKAKVRTEIRRGRWGRGRLGVWSDSGIGSYRAPAFSVAPYQGSCGLHWHPQAGVDHLRLAYPRLCVQSVCVSPPASVCSCSTAGPWRQSSWQYIGLALWVVNSQLFFWCRHHFSYVLFVSHKAWSQGEIYPPLHGPGDRILEPLFILRLWAGVWHDPAAQGDRSFVMTVA